MMQGLIGVGQLSGDGGGHVVRSTENELCCIGSGDLSKQLLQRNSQAMITGIDFSENSLNYGRKIAEGTFEDIARNQELKEAYLGQ